MGGGANKKICQTDTGRHTSQQKEEKAFARRLATLVPSIVGPQKNLFALKRPKGGLGKRLRWAAERKRGEKVWESKVRNWREADILHTQYIHTHTMAAEGREGIATRGARE